MTSVTLKPTNVASFPHGGGHFWVFMQYVDGLRKLGCDIHWLERFESQGSVAADRRALRLFRRRMEQFGLADRAVLYRRASGGRPIELTSDERNFDAVLRSDLLFNFDYSIEPELLDQFELTALVDIDPGLLQFWVSTGQLAVAEHDLYLTTGETVGTPRALFSDLGRTWIRFRPPVSLDLWPFVFDPNASKLTTVSGWWGGNGKGEWITDGETVFFENNKRVTFLEVRELPTMTDQPIELALAMGEGDHSVAVREDPAGGWKPTRPVPDSPTDYVSDRIDRAELEHHGWLVKRAAQVADSPERYREYVQGSRGEFSCAKPSCIYFQNAWVSDRTLCYLASGKPAIVQDTGRSSLLPSGDGLFRFRDLDGAIGAIEAMNADYRYHCEAARDLAKSNFDAATVLGRLLDDVFRTAPPRPQSVEGM